MNPGVGAIVIGRNEGARLAPCLRSVREQIDHVVYVDSGSTDDSADIARGIGVHVIVLESGPYTAARGRQTGLDALARLAPDLRYVQFIDGDCVLRKGWVAKARAALDADDTLCAVTGRRREERCAESVFSRLIDIDWDIPGGEVPYFGGDSLVRIRAVVEVGGWSTDLIAGEEPDLCFRMRGAGYRVLRLDVPMTGHEIGMTSAGQYWRRGVRSGYAYAQVGWRHRRGHGRSWMRRTVSILVHGLALPVAFVAALVWFWPAAIGIALVYLRLVVTMVRYVRRKGHGWRLALGYALLNTLCRVGEAIGAMRFLLDVALRRRSAIIEYKTAASGSPELS